MPSVDEMAAAIKARDAAEAERLLAADASLAHATAATGDSMLLLAAYHQCRPIVDLLLSRGARPNLWEAAAIGRIDRVRELLNGNAAHVNAHSHDGWTPLHLASFFGQKEVATFLLGRGAAVDARSTNHLANTPLHAAAAAGQRTCVAILLQHGADPNATYLDGLTPLHVAAANGDEPSVRLLLSSKADPQARATGKTALDMAREKGHDRIARLLAG